MFLVLFVLQLDRQCITLTDGFFLTLFCSFICEGHIRSFDYTTWLKSFQLFLISFRVRGRTSLDDSPNNILAFWATYHTGLFGQHCSPWTEPCILQEARGTRRSLCLVDISHRSAVYEHDSHTKIWLTFAPSTICGYLWKEGLPVLFHGPGAPSTAHERNTQVDSTQRPTLQIRPEDVSYLYQLILGIKSLFCRGALILLLYAKKIQTCLLSNLRVLISW